MNNLNYGCCNTFYFGRISSNFKVNNRPRSYHFFHINLEILHIENKGAKADYMELNKLRISDNLLNATRVSHNSSTDKMFDSFFYACDVSPLVLYDLQVNEVANYSGQLS